MEDLANRVGRTTKKVKFGAQELALQTSCTWVDPDTVSPVSHPRQRQSLHCCQFSPSKNTDLEQGSPKMRIKKNLPPFSITTSEECYTNQIKHVKSPDVVCVLPLCKLCITQCSTMLEIRPKDFHSHNGFPSHTHSKELGFGATLYVNLDYKFILSIIHTFNIFYKIP